MNHLDRRSFIAASGLAAASTLAARAGSPAAKSAIARQPDNAGDAHRGPCVIASLNGMKAVARAMEALGQGADPAEAAVQGVKLVEDDPNDDSVGLGGLPNEDGIVELDASVMHGPTHKSGAVASLRNIKNPASVALLVLRRTDHCLLVGEGALRFARAQGFQEENLLTERSRKAWIKWKENVGKGDDWLSDDQIDRWKSDPADVPRAGEPRHGLLDDIRFHYGTIHCAAVDKDGDLGSCTTTSGLSWKIAGRVGDSPIIGAGNYCDNAIGAAGSTGRGEATIVNLAAYAAVREMEAGLAPTEACLKVVKRIADRTREKRLLDAKGRPTFDVSMYALRKDGACGAATLYRGGKFAMHDGKAASAVESAWLFER